MVQYDPGARWVEIVRTPSLTGLRARIVGCA